MTDRCVLWKRPMSSIGYILSVPFSNNSFTVFSFTPSDPVAVAWTAFKPMDSRGGTRFLDTRWSADEWMSGSLFYGPIKPSCTLNRHVAAFMPLRTSLTVNIFAAKLCYATTISARLAGSRQ